MKDFIIGLAILAVGYFLELSVFRGHPEKVFYAFEILGGLLIVSGIGRGLLGRVRPRE